MFGSVCAWQVVLASMCFMLELVCLVYEMFALVCVFQQQSIDMFALICMCVCIGLSCMFPLACMHCVFAVDCSMLGCNVKIASVCLHWFAQACC